jgi:general stress protein 26
MDSDIRNAFWNALDDSPFVMMRLSEAGSHSQPMTVMLDRQAHHTVWFFMHQSSTLAVEAQAEVDFSSSGHKLFAALSGHLHREQDRTVLDRLWSNKVEAWFPGGKTDPTLALMRFEITKAEVWTADITLAGLFDLFTGIAIKPDQAGKHAVGLL